MSTFTSHDWEVGLAFSVLLEGHLTHMFTSIRDKEKKRYYKLGCLNCENGVSWLNQWTLTRSGCSIIEVFVVSFDLLLCFS